jgi:hypothetical protein
MAELRNIITVERRNMTRTSSSAGIVLIHYWPWLVVAAAAVRQAPQGPTPRRLQHRHRQSRRRPIKASITVVTWERSRSMV